ncbi:uncharacterized protein RCC_06199 [Ramularia collo-cygni]|uniref:Uncharacterized protein n=1 Tax=Ramularia collo-cygni TaxID=112498 RepID=A0A2D3V4G1_9PEZI|nr:uncharacterized protein RCC_06199 [Ramularia collo-cygni]CZT20340.1 uncharacterized protein RCC_06199 [Ramularia collo-cygni]
MENSNFIRLSPEIRNEIWTNVFASPCAVNVKLQSDKLQHPLTQTCQQIRHETLAMFYSLTRFNAHLGSGPTAPLLKWLRKLDAENLLIINEVNIWGLHNLNNGTLYGSETSQALLLKGPQKPSSKYILQPVSGWIFAQHGRLKVLKEVILALHSVGLGLLRFCIVGQHYDERDDLGEDGEERDDNNMHPPSSLALVRLDSRPAGSVFADSTTNIDWLAQSWELTERARVDLICGLANDQIKVEVLDGMRRIVFDFTSLELGGRVECVENIEEGYRKSMLLA